MSNGGATCVTGKHFSTTNSRRKIKTKPFQLMYVRHAPYGSNIDIFLEKKHVDDILDYIRFVVFG